MQTDIGLGILVLHRQNKTKDVDREVNKLSYSQLESFIDIYNQLGEFELAQKLFNRKSL